MLDLRLLREQPDATRAALERRGEPVDIESILKLDAEVRDLMTRRDESRAEQKRISKEVPRLEGGEREEAVARSKEKGAEVAECEGKLKPLQVELQERLLQLPNVPDPEVPDGESAEQNVEQRRWGEPRQEPWMKDHLALAESLDLIDVKHAAHFAGSRTYILKGDLVLLELAVLRYALDFIASRGFVPHSPPVMVRREAMEGTGYLPVGADQSYELTRDDGWLVGTSEVPLTAIHAGETLKEKDLPLKYAGISACWRREAGTYGKDTHGVFRVHQFTKVEQVVIGRNDRDETLKLHEEIVQNAEQVLQALKLPYRVVSLSTGDLGRQPAYTYDIETWMPGRGAYGETHSASRYYDFQTRRLNLRYKAGSDKPQFCHTLNNTVIASPRILVTLLENYQREDGTVEVPEVLVPLVGKQVLGA